jgi:hypothetical protein
MAAVAMAVRSGWARRSFTVEVQGKGQQGTVEEDHVGAAV